jgi:hypothetical protein
MSKAIAILMLLATACGASWVAWFDAAYEQAGRSTAMVEAPTTNGLVAYWDMSTSGATVIDLAGTNNGTAVNSPTFGAAYGVRGDGVLLNGTNQYISTVMSSVTTNGTISAWAMRRTNQVCAVFSRASDSTTNLFIFGFTSSAFPEGEGKLYAQVRSEFPNEYLMFSSNSIAVNTTNHIAITANGSAWRMYINGQQVGTSIRSGGSGFSQSSWFSSVPSLRQGIGARRLSTPDTFHAGSIDEVRIYNRALTSNEVATIYNYDKTGAGL